MLSTTKLPTRLDLFIASSYVCKPRPGSKPPSGIPLFGDDGSKPNKFKWLPVKPVAACPKVDSGV